MAFDRCLIKDYFFSYLLNTSLQLTLLLLLLLMV